MNKILFSLLVIFLFAACGDKQRYVISGSGEGFSEGYKVYLLQPSDDGVQLVSTAVIKNNAFEIKGRVENPYDAVMAVCDSTHVDEQTMKLLSKDGRLFSLHLFVEPGNITVIPYDRENGLTAKAVGTPLNELYNKFEADVDSVKNKIGDDPDTMFGFIVPFIKKNISNLVGVTVFECWHWSMPADMKKEILDSLEALYGDKYAALSAETRERLQYERLRDEQRKSVQAGCKYKDIEEENADGKLVSLRSVVENPKNRYVLLDFWATWCRPCMAEVPNLISLYKRYKNNGFEIYAVSLDDSADVWASAVKEKGMQWVNVLLDQGSDTPAKYGLCGAGANFLIDCATGDILATELYGDALVEKLSSLFGE